MSYPTDKQTLTKAFTDTSKVEAVHPEHHNDLGVIADSLQDKVGINSSTDTASIDYQLNNPASISPGHKHEISDNTDFDNTGVTDGQLPVWNDTTGQYEPNSSTTPDGSTTLAGKFEEATEAEVVAGTAVGGTGSRLAVNPTSIVDKILTALERTWTRAIEGVTTPTEVNQLAGTTHIAESDTFFGATDMSGAEAETLTDGSDADTLHVHEGVYLAVASDTLQSSADTERSDNTNTYVKLKELQINRTGTIRLNYNIKSGGIGSLIVQIRDAGGNVLATGNASSAGYTTITNDLTITEPTALQLWGYNNNSGSYIYVNDYRILYTMIITANSSVTTD